MYTSVPHGTNPAVVCIPVCVPDSTRPGVPTRRSGEWRWRDGVHVGPRDPSTREGDASKDYFSPDSSRGLTGRETDGGDTGRTSPDRATETCGDS